MNILPSALSILVVCGLIAHIATKLLIDAAATLGLVQTPNERSSHVSPTPTGGGIAFAMVGVLSGIALSIGNSILVPFVFCCAILAIAGSVDDRFQIPAKWRLLVQCAAAGIACFFIINALNLPPFWSVVLGVASTIAGIWLINSINFMDGVDGLVSLQSVLILSAILLLRYAHFGTLQQADLWAVAVLGALCGFFLLNQPPAKIFMGDAGSYFIGGFLLCYAMYTTLVLPHFGYAWLLLLAPLVVDSTLTLVRRVMRGDHPFQAHRKHGYQILARRFNSHFAPTYGYAGFVIFLCLPFAFFAFAQPEFAILIVMFVYTVLLGALWLVGAGNDAHE